LYKTRPAEKRNEDWPQKADARIIETLGKRGNLRPVRESWFWDYLLRKLP
jgi:hypothetical protein